MRLNFLIFCYLLYINVKKLHNVFSFFNKSLKIPLENLLPVCYNLDVKGDEFYFYETNYR